MNENSNKASSAAPLGGVSWPLIVGTLTMLTCLGWVRSRLLLDPDTYLHVTAGRWMLEHQALPSGDVFSYTRYGAPWAAHEWLAELIYAAAYQLSGWAGPLLLASLAFAVTTAFLTRYLLRYMEPIHALLLVVAAAASMTNHLLARPHVLAWPLLALWCVGLTHAVENQQRPPWWLLAVMFVWANLHGGFTLGLALEIPFALESILATPSAGRVAEAKRWATFMLASGLAAMATPSGWRGLWFPFQLMSLEQLGTYTEWRPTIVGALPPFEIWLMLLFGLALSGRFKLPWVRLLLFLGLLHLAFAHGRHVSMLVLLATIFLVPTLARQWYAAVPAEDGAQKLDRFFRTLAAPARLSAIIGAGAVVIVTAVIVNQFDKYQPPPSFSPEPALQAALAAGARGPVFNEHAFGGFLIFRNIPVFIDGRADLYGDEFLKAYLSAAGAEKQEDLTTLLNQYKVTWTLLRPGTPAAARLDALPDWRRAYADDNAVVHLRADAARQATDVIPKP